MKRTLLLAILLASCAAPNPRREAEAAGATSEVRATGVAYRAVGQEPGWILDIGNDRSISLSWENGRERAEFPPIDPRYPRWNGEIYSVQANGHDLHVEVRRRSCVDEMNGEVVGDSVKVTIDGRELRGCGGRL